MRSSCPGQNPLYGFLETRVRDKAVIYPPAALAKRQGREGVQNTVAVVAQSLTSPFSLLDRKQKNK